MPGGFSIETFNEQEAFSFGGLWTCNYKVNGIEIPGNFVLKDAPIKNDRFCCLVKIDVQGHWQKDIRYSLLIIDLATQQLLRSIRDFPALSIAKITDDSIYYRQRFENGEIADAERIEISKNNFIIIGSLGDTNH